MRLTGERPCRNRTNRHRRWIKEANYKDAYDALGEEFDLARALIEARTSAGLSQSELVRRMKTSQSLRAFIYQNGSMSSLIATLGGMRDPDARGWSCDRSGDSQPCVI